MIWPALWIAYTLIHGAITDWYPYPFIDVVANGYATVAANIVAVTVFALVLSLAFVGLNRWRRAQQLRRKESARRESPRSARR